MLIGLCHIARRGLLSQVKLDILSNDLANVGSFGYKRSGTVFKLPDPEDPSKVPYHMKLEPYGVQGYIDFSAGNFKQTGNPLDLAIQGNGFFVVETPQGNLYTKRGDFGLDSQGRIVTQDGKLVLGEGGPIAVPDGELYVDEQGNVFSNQEPIGKLRIVTFQDLTVLEKTEGNYFKLKDPNLTGQERPAENVEVWQGFLELSNVDVVTSMIEMLTLLRGYEAYKNVMDALTEADRKLAHEVGAMR